MLFLLYALYDARRRKIMLNMRCALLKIFAFYGRSMNNLPLTPYCLLILEYYIRMNTNNKTMKKFHFTRVAEVGNQKEKKV